MDYIFDIVLNFQSSYYNFFEWNRFDNIKNIYKISTYHITDKDLIDLKNNQIQVSTNLINKIISDNPKHKKIICLVSNGSNALGLLFDEFGNLLKRSSLIFEEETEVNNLVKNLPLLKIEYLKNIKQKPSNILRIEKEKKDLLKKYLEDLTDESTLKYLYYEYFNKESTEINNIKPTLLKEIDKEWSNQKQKLYQIISLLTKNKLPSK